MTASAAAAAAPAPPPPPSLADMLLVVEAAHRDMLDAHRAIVTDAEQLKVLVEKFKEARPLTKEASNKRLFHAQPGDDEPKASVALMTARKTASYTFFLVNEREKADKTLRDATTKYEQVCKDAVVRDAKLEAKRQRELFSQVWAKFSAAHPGEAFQFRVAKLSAAFDLPDARTQLIEAEGVRARMHYLGLPFGDSPIRLKRPRDEEDKEASDSKRARVDELVECFTLLLMYYDHHGEYDEFIVPYAPAFRTGRLDEQVKLSKNPTARLDSAFLSSVTAAAVSHTRHTGDDTVTVIRSCVDAARYRVVTHKVVWVHKRRS